MLKVNTKFKVGDKVKILPSATRISVAKNEVGVVGEIIHIYDQDGLVVNTVTERYVPWVVRAKDIVPVVKVGEQLEFSFMG